MGGAGRLFVALALSIASFAANAQTCTVASVHDGDTLRLQCPGSAKTIPVRLERIDAPEIHQAGGIASRDYLRQRCPVGSTVRLSSAGVDRYGRTLGDVDCGHGSAQEDMLRSGHAWVYMPKFTADRRMMDMQQAAMQKRLGLWGLPERLPPWEWRRRQQ